MQPIASFFRFSITIICLMLLIGLVYINRNLHYVPKTIELEGRIVNMDILSQLHYLKKELAQGAGDDMQKLFPEGFVFINVLYGLSWCNFLENLPKGSALYNEGKKEIEWALDQLNTEKTKSIFNADLPIRYGAFYTGWKNYLLGKKLKILNISDRKTEDVNQYLADCQHIKSAMSDSFFLWLPSYTSGVWPADNLVCIASLNICPDLRLDRNKQFLEQWVIRTKKILDSQTGLIPHSAYTGGGINEPPRGSSQCLMLYMLADIDADFAKNQFKKFKDLFLDQHFGLPYIREYPKGNSGNGDVDSGPVIWNVGGAASIVGIGTLKRFGECTLSANLRNAIEAFTFAFSKNGQKSHCLGLMPMADAFIVWSNSTGNCPIEESTNSTLWRIQLVFLIIALFLIYCIWRCLRPIFS
jgi:hypothetical protein